MKKIITIIILLCTCILLKAQIPVSGYITTIGPTDTYPVTLDSLGAGGYTTTYNYTTRNAIPAARRKIGMMAHYIASDSTFILIGGIANSNWVYKSLTGGSGTWGSITGTLSAQTDLQNALNAKQNTITTGTNLQYFRGDFSLATFPTNLSAFTNGPGYITLPSLSGTAPILYNSATGAISIQTATSSLDGALSHTDWTTFNNKQATLVSGTNIKTINGSTILGAGNLVTPTVNIYNTDGTLTADRTVNANFHNFTINDNLTGYSQSSTDINIQAFTSGFATHTQLQQGSGTLNLAYYDNSSNESGLQFSAASLSVVDQVNNIGLVNLGNYEANFTSKSLTTKRYVDSAITAHPGGVSSVSNSDGTLTISPTTGAVVGSIALNHANSWTNQTFGTGTVINGLPTGTGVSSTAAASTLVARDANGNTNINNVINNGTSTNTTNGTTTLVVGSSPYQYFTGTAGQTVILPATPTLQLYQEYFIVNNATGLITVESSGGNVINTVVGNSMLEVQCISLTGTGASSWADFLSGAALNYLPLSLTSNVTVTTGSNSVNFSGGSQSFQINGGYVDAGAASGSTVSIGSNVDGNGPGINGVHIGSSAGFNTGGANNTLVGYHSGGPYASLSFATFIGANTVSSINALTDVIAIGNGATVNSSHETVIGTATTTLASIFGKIAPGSWQTVTAGTDSVLLVNNGLIGKAPASAFGGGSTGANPTASIGFTAVNGTATTFIRSDGAPKADSTVIRSVANSYSLSGMQTKLNNYLLSATASTTYALQATTISPGYGMTGGGSLAANRTLTADTTLLKSKAGFLTDYNNLSGRITTNTTNIATNTASIAAKEGLLTLTAVKTANYTLSPYDIAVGDVTSGTFTFTLPNAPADGTLVEVKMNGQTGTNSISLAVQGVDVFNGGGTTASLVQNFQAITFKYKLSNHTWYSTSTNLALGLLDTRYLLFANQGTATTVYHGNATGNGSFGSIVNSDIAAGTIDLTAKVTGLLPDANISSAANWNTAYTNRITSLTNTGSSGAATLTANVLNIPNYTLSGLGGVPTTTTVAGFALSGNITLATLTAGSSLTNTVGSNYNGSAATTLDINLANTNTFTVVQNINKAGISTTPTDALLLENTTAAALNAQQYSSAINFAGFGWGTTASTSQSVNARIYLVPVQGTTPSSQINFDFANSGGTYVNKFSFSSAGVLSATSNISATGQVSAGSVFLNSKSGILTTSTDGLLLSNSNGSTLGNPAQWATRINWQSTAWNTTSTASNTLNAILEMQTASAAVPTNTLAISFQNATLGGGYTKQFTFGNTGVLGLSATGLFSFNGVIGTAGQVPVVNSGATAMTWINPFTGLIVGTPTIAAGTGAGTSPTVSVTSNGKQLQVTVTTGTLPTGTNATIATVTLASALSYTPYPTFVAASANSSLLTGASMIYMTSTGASNVTITSGTTALTAATTYIWNISL